MRSVDIYVLCKQMHVPILVYCIFFVCFDESISYVISFKNGVSASVKYIKL